MTKPKPAQAEMLRIAADLIESMPSIPAPCVWAYSSGTVAVQWQLMHNADTKDGQRLAAQQIIRAVGGKWDKKPSGDSFNFEREYRGLGLEILADREQVCDRRVVGTEDVTIPAVEARPERVEVREIVEWDCSPVLAEVSA